MRRKREQPPQLPPEETVSAEPVAGEPVADEPTDAPPRKRAGVLEAIKDAARDAALRRTSTKR